jgi:hypothetical protein
MNALRVSAWAGLLLSIVIGSFARVPKPELIEIDGYRVLAADFHSHMFPGDWAMLAPWDAVLDAERYGLDVIALTGHNYTWTGALGAWFGIHYSGPLVIAGEEVHTPHYHLLGIGINKTVPWRLSAADAIDEIHRQGGIAIAAHPVARYWSAYDTAAVARLDAAEVVHPEGLRSPTSAAEFIRFAQRGNFAAIGDSDSHGSNVRLCRTYVFVREVSKSGVLEALRNHRTVVYDRGRYYGDAHLVQLAKSDGRLARNSKPEVSGLTVAARVVGMLALLVVIVAGLPKAGNVTRRREDAKKKLGSITQR